MENHECKHDGKDRPSTYRERSLFLPVLGLLTVVFTGAFVAAFVLTVNIITFKLLFRALVRICHHKSFMKLKSVVFDSFDLTTVNIIC